MAKRDDRRNRNEEQDESTPSEIPGENIPSDRPPLGPESDPNWDRGNPAGPERDPNRDRGGPEGPDTPL
jgi:hypothetical protein